MSEKLISKEISERILTIGPGDHDPYVGGMGYLINVYYRNFAVFKYIKTQDDKFKKSPVRIVSFFIKQYFKIIWSLTTDRAIKIVHLHGASYGSFYRKYIVFLTAKYLYRKKVFYHMHGADFKIFYKKSNSIVKSFIRHFVKNTDVLICLSESWKTFFETEFKEIKRIEILLNAINRNNYIEKTNESYLKKQKVNFLFLGVVGERKGIFDLLNVIISNKSKLDGKFNLKIGGNGEEARIIELIEKNNLGSLVQFEGWVSGDKKENLLNSSDVYILPSYNEGLPISILEAMGFELPIISTVVGGIPDLVINNKNGFLVEPGNEQQIFDSINAFINNPKLLMQMGKESGTIANKYFPENILPQLNSLYTEMLNDSANQAVQKSVAVLVTDNN